MLCVFNVGSNRVLGHMPSGLDVTFAGDRRAETAGGEACGFCLEGPSPYVRACVRLAESAVR